MWHKLWVQFFRNIRLKLILRHEVGVFAVCVSVSSSNIPDIQTQSASFKSSTQSKQHFQNTVTFMKEDLLQDVYYQPVVLLYVVTFLCSNIKDVPQRQTLHSANGPGALLPSLFHTSGCLTPCRQTYCPLQVSSSYSGILFPSMLIFTAPCGRPIFLCSAKRRLCFSSRLMAFL